MRAFFNDGAARHDRDDVSRLDGGQPVSDDDAGSSFSGLVQSRLDRLRGDRGNIFCVLLTCLHSHNDEHHKQLREGETCDLLALCVQGRGGFI